MSQVTYEELTRRNEGFLDREEQQRLRGSSVFVCGVGGMGGSAVETLTRAGVGRIGIADFDVFEATNLNRQVFACTRTLGRAKTEATEEALTEINPHLRVERFGREWSDQLDEILGRYDLVVNGMDDLRASLALYRAARSHGVTVVDAFVSPEPSVNVVRPDDPRPEEWLGFPTTGVPANEVTESQLACSLLHELSYVAAVSGGLERLPETLLGEMLRGERPRCSFAPMVVISGNLMASEAVAVLLGRPSGAGYRGYFLDPWSGRVERPGNPILVSFRRRRAFGRLARLAGRGKS
jgi:molybdopterin/thiamine biosynthesis adenylyltransferase